MSDSRLLQKTAEYAWSQNGTLATPGNYLSNPKFTEYLAATGRGPGLDYCLAFICWAFARASADLGVENPLVANELVSAHVPTFYKLALDKKLVVTTPRPGDIGVVKDLSHAAFVLRLTGVNAQYPPFNLNPFVPFPDDGKDMVTIEGNTHIGSDAHPIWGVHKRSKSTSRHFFVRV